MLAEEPAVVERDGAGPVETAARYAVPAALILLLSGVVVMGLVSSTSRPSSVIPAGREEALPSPRLPGPVSLEEALLRRRSVREFTGVPLTRDEIGQLLWAAQGVTDGQGRRTAPSAGALYPLEVDAVVAEGVARYLPDGHRLAWRGTADLRPALQRAALDQPQVGDAALVLVISAVPERTAARYGSRTDRYVALEAGHAAQNVLLEAVALGLGAVPVGSFDDAEVGRLLGLAAGEEPLYLVAIGRPR
jgi:SagB-type dehydrogenase family enzyme